jgi:hypothetical protein
MRPNSCRGNDWHSLGMTSNSTVVSVLGGVQEHCGQVGNPVIDGRIQTLLLAFTAAPVLQELHLQFSSGVTISGNCLVSGLNASCPLLSRRVADACVC